MARRVNTKPNWRAELRRYRAERDKSVARVEKETKRIEWLDERIAESERLGILAIVGANRITPEQLENLFLRRLADDERHDSDDETNQNDYENNQETEDYESDEETVDE